MVSENGLHLILQEKKERKRRTLCMMFKGACCSMKQELLRQAINMTHRPYSGQSKALIIH